MGENKPTYSRGKLGVLSTPYDLPKKTLHVFVPRGGGEDTPSLILDYLYHSRMLWPLATTKNRYMFMEMVSNSAVDMLYGSTQFHVTFSLLTTWPRLGMGPFNCYVTLFWTKFDTTPPPVTLCNGEIQLLRNAFLENFDTPPPPCVT